MAADAKAEVAVAVVDGSSYGFRVLLYDIALRIIALSFSLAAVVSATLYQDTLNIQRFTKSVTAKWFFVMANAIVCLYTVGTIAFTVIYHKKKVRMKMSFIISDIFMGTLLAVSADLPGWMMGINGVSDYSIILPVLGSNVFLFLPVVAVARASLNV